MNDEFDLPEEVRETGFSYPPEYAATVAQGLTDLNPWYLLTTSEVLETYEDWKKLYPPYESVDGARYLLFARRNDCDDAAFFVARGKGYNRGDIIVCHVWWQRPGWSVDHRFTTFWDWFRFAVEEMIEWHTS
jgi:hypothetical protein